MKDGGMDEDMSSLCPLLTLGRTISPMVECSIPGLSNIFVKGPGAF